MRITYKLIVFSLFFTVLSTHSALALSSTGSTDKSDYNINATINYTIAADQNLTSNITIYLINSSGSVFNHTSITPNATNFTTQVNSTVPRSGDYIVKANFTLNNTYYETSQIVKISKAHSIVISSNKATYSPGEAINFTVRATDLNNIGVSDENITVRLLYTNNDTILSSKAGLTNAAGEYTGTFTAPNTIGSYRLTVNEWVTIKLIDISAFDLVAFVGDVNGNIETKFSQGDTAYIYMDLFDTNKTRYAGTETLSLQITYPNGTQNTSTSYTFTGSRLNTSFVLNDIGEYKAKVTAVSTSKSITFPIDVGKYELTGSLERNSTSSTTFFPNEGINIRVKVFNVSSGEVIKTTNLDETFELHLLDSSFLNSSSISNTTTVDTTTGARTFTFNAPNVTGLYYVKIRLNQSQLILDMKVTSTLPTASPVDQNYNFKNIFVGNKQVIRIITILENSSSQINVTNISVASLKTVADADVTASTVFNTSITEYKGFKAGLVEFASPSSAGLYFLRTLVNNNFAAETQFIVKLYTACAQLDGYRWFVSSNEDVNLTVRVAEAQDVGIIDSLAGNASDSTNTESGSFSSIYGMYDCYAAYKTTSSGTSTAGNNTANIRVTIKKVVNTLTGDDVTTKVSNLPSNTTDDNGKVALGLKRPSGGWDGGTYVVELELRDKNNNTDKGFGAFQVKNLWINVWPQQISGRWKWYFSPTENMTFDVSAYNSTGTWYYYGNSQGTGDNCYLLDVFYQGNGIEWFWPPKKISSNKYNWTCTNSNSTANGRFTLRVNHTTPTDVFDSGYYMIRVKVNTTSGVGDSGEGWFSIKAYNVYARTTSINYYDSWYRGPTDNVTIDIDVTYANSTKWDCYWQKCPSTELVKENLNISAKLIKYDQWMPSDYQKDKYLVLFANSSVASLSTSSLTTFNDSSIVANVSVNTTKNATFIEERFKSGNITITNLAAATRLASAGSNASVTVEIPQNATINSAFILVLTNESLIANISLNTTSSFFNLTTNATGLSNYALNASFTNSLNTFLSGCTANPAGNCTAAINATLNGSGVVTFSSLRINYNQVRNVQTSSNTSVLGLFITLPRNATINSAFFGLNMTSGNFTANVSLTDGRTLNTLVSNFFSTDNLNVTLNNISFANHLTTSLASCTPSGSGNCTIGFNLTLYGTGVATISNPRVTFNTTTTTQTTSSSFINTTSGNVNLTLVPRGGKNSDSWASGYYTVGVSVDGPQGKETGNYWFEIRSFFVNLQPVKPNNVRQVAYAYSSGQNITVNISATNKPSWLYNSYGVSNVNNIPANITAIRLSYWDQTTYQMRETSVTWTPSVIDNTTTVNITPASTLTAGNWYNLEITMTDANGNNQTGWAGFQIKDFTLSARTKNWQYAFTNAENISLDVAVCDTDTYWCNFGSNSYSGNNVAVSVTKLMKSDSWPYTAVSGWTANTSTLSSSNNGQGIITISPTSNLSGGYYSAELSAQYASGSGSNTTTNVWFKLESFKLEVQGIKWEYSMSENVTLKIKTSAAATLSDAQITCGYWPDQTSYSLSGGTLSANSTSLSAGENLIMLSPSGKNWVSGYCYGYLTVSSGGESQQGYTSFSMKAFTLSVSQAKYAYLKNESVVLIVSSDASQQFNITGMNISIYSYENSSDAQLRLGEHFSSNGTNKNFTGSAIINITPTSGNWSFKGWHNGKISVVASNNKAISQTGWFYFDIRDVLYMYGWPVVSDTSNYFTPNTSSETINLRVYTYKYSQSGSSWWPYNSIGGVNVTITSIEKQSCSSYPCSYSNVTGWTAATGTSKSDGTAQLNITRSGGWPDGWHYVNVRLLDTATGESATFNKNMGFWVNK